MTCSTSPGSRRGSFGSSGKTCSLPQVFTDVVESFHAGAEAKHLKLEAVLAGGTPQLIATDRLRLQQILVNLIDDVTVCSIPSVGSTFTLMVPVGEPAPDEVTQSQPPGKHQESPSSRETALPGPRLHARILLAEDHDANWQVITLRLNSIGAEVVPARNGKE